MRVILLILSLAVLQGGCLSKSDEAVWVKVEAEKAGFSIECPKGQTSSDEQSVRFDEAKKKGYLQCRYGDVVFFVNTEEWNVASDARENAERFYDSLAARGDGDLTAINLNSEPKTIQSYNGEFQSIGRHFLIDKTAFHLDVAFSSKRFEKVENLNERQTEIAERFFNSFELLKE